MPEGTPFADAHTHSPERRAGVLRVCNIPRSSWDGKLEQLAPFCAGLHPKEIHPETLENDLMELEGVLKLGGIAALGECGLDRLAETSMELQTQAFQAQAKLTERLKLPLVIHCVRAFPEIIALKKKLTPSCAWIVHGFRGNAQSASELARHGFMISFGAALLRAQPALIEALKTVPLEALLLETDEAEEPIESVYAAASELRGEGLETLKSAVSNSFRKTFRLGNLLG